MATDADGAYVAKPVVCHGCAAKEDAAANKDHARSSGRYWSVTREE